MSRHSRNGFLTREGYQLAEERGAQKTSLEGLAPRGVPEYIDKGVSVSALVEVEDLYAFVDDWVLDQQYRRFLNGC